MRELPTVTWWRFFLWLAAGMILYWGAGMDESKLATKRDPNQLPGGFKGLLIIGIGLQLAGGILWFLTHVLSQAKSGSGVAAINTVYAAATLLAYAGLVIWVRGCGKYAFTKGYSHWFGLFGLVGPLGLAILFGLPNKTVAPLSHA
jgi:hypothetical protein